MQRLLAKVSKPEFALLAAVAVKVLSLLTPANSMMQGKSCSITLAAELRSNAREAITQMMICSLRNLLPVDTGMIKDEQPRKQRAEQASDQGSI